MDATVTALTPANEAALLAEATPITPVVETALMRLQALPTRNKWLIGAGVAALVALLIGVSAWNKPDAYAPLFAGALSDKDAGAAATQLTQMNVAYKVLDGGRIMVPADKAAELRMKLAAIGLPKGTVNGFELLDNPRYGQSQQQERTYLQRALEGELTRTIGTLSAVESARVHLAMPQQNGFFREQVKPSASVVLNMHPGRILDRNQIAGIVHLVSSSVPDLATSAVSIIDQNGSLLSTDPARDGKQDMTQQQRQHVAQVEAIYLKRVQEILEPALGKDNLRATVTADVDFSESEQASETYRPNGTPDAATVRSQRNLETANGGTVQPTGVPGAATNQTPQAATAPVSGASASPLQAAGMGGTGGGLRKENQVNYEVDKTVRNTRFQTNAIKRVNVAVLVNYRAAPVDPKAKVPAQPQPPSAEELQKLTALVQEAVGFNKDRGDSVKVEALPFRIEAEKPEPVPTWRQPWVVEMLKVAGIPAALVLVALLLVFAVIRPALKKPVPEPTAEELAAQAAAEAGLDAVVGDEEEEPEVDPAQLLALENAQMESKLVDARQLVRDNPVAVANILKTWIHGEEAAV